MENIMYKPVIGVVMCRNRLKGHQTQTLQEKYLNAIVNAGGLPIALPHALAEPELLNAVVDKLDGIYLPGSPSNVQPHLYGENGDEPDADPGRDLLSMALINAALERRIPIFAICRGLQELVVATGGTLYRRLFEQPELLEHREDPELPVEQQYAPSHLWRCSGREDCCRKIRRTKPQHVLGKLATWARGKNPQSAAARGGASAGWTGGSGQRERSSFRAGRTVASRMEQ